MMIKFEINFSKTVVLELNYQCNLRCVHCYIPCEEKSPRRFMEYDDAKKLLDQIKNLGFNRILITGGEPFLNPDFDKIYTYAWNQGFIINLFTNATLMNEKIKNLLINRKPDLIRVSLFGGDSESYNNVTGENLFFIAYKNIVFLKKNGINVTVKIPLLRQIEFKTMRDTQKELSNMGISTKIEVRILPRFDGDKETINYRYTPDEIITLQIDNTEKGIKHFEEKKKCLEKRVKNINYCIHTCQPFVINPECHLQLCFFIREWFVDLKSIPFEKASKLLVEKISNEYMDIIDFECEDCNKQYMCPYCPGWAKTEVGMINQKIPFLCKLVEKYENKYNMLKDNK